MLCLFLTCLSQLAFVRGEAKVTNLALERLLSGVTPHVLQQVALIPGIVAARAHIALEWGRQQVLLVVSL